MGGMLYWLCTVLMTIGRIFNQSTMVGWRHLLMCSGGGSYFDDTWFSMVNHLYCTYYTIGWCSLEAQNQPIFYIFSLDINWRAPSSSETIHNLPFGLNSFAKPDMASQNDARSCVRRYIQLSNQSMQLIASFCEAMRGFAKLLRSAADMWIVLAVAWSASITYFHGRPRWMHQKWMPLCRM